MGFAVIIVYMLVMVSIGLWAMRKTKSVGDFFLGGRSIGPWMSAFAYGTTYFSAVLFIGYGGKLGWGFGINTLWIVAGNVLVGSLLAWLVLGKRTRDMTVRLQAMTMPAFLGERYRCSALKIASALLIFIFLVPYSAGVYLGLRYLFQVALGMSEINALMFLAVLTSVYLVLGGYFAVTLTDFLMGIVMLFGAAAMLYILVGGAGGVFHANSLLLANPEITAPALQPGPPGSIPGWMTLASLVVVTSLGVWGLPQMVQKFYSIRSADQVKRATIVTTLFALVITTGAYYTGALTHINIPPSKSAMVKVQSTDADGPYTPKTALPLKMDKQGNPVVGPTGKPEVDWDAWMPTFLSQRLPAWMMLVIVLLVFSASMSTLSSLVLVSSSAIAMDLFAGVAKPNVEKKTVLALMRVLCAVFILVSLAMALKPPAIIINLMVVSWGVLAGAFGAPYFYGLFWRRTNAFGAGAGMLVGVCTALTLYWKLGQPGVPVAGAVAILVPYIIVPIATMLTKPMPKEAIDTAFVGTQG